MEIDNFLGTPEAAKHILANPHGRRMVCAHLVLNSTTPWSELVISTIESLPDDAHADVKRLLGKIPCSAMNTSAFLRCGLLDKISPEDEAFSVFQTVAKMALWSALANNVTKFDMANPVLTSEAIDALWNAPKTTYAAKSALAANPNAPKRLTAAFIIAPENAGNYAACVARFGDLQNKANVQTVLAEEYDSIAKSTIYHYLAGRADLPPEVVIHIESRCDQLAYTILSRQPNFRKAIPMPESDNLNTILTKECVRLPPDASKETVLAVNEALGHRPYSELMGSMLEARAIIASHPNAPEGLMKAAIEDDAVRKFIGVTLPIAESPHAAWALPLICEKQSSTGSVSHLYSEISTIRDCPPDLLDWALETPPAITKRKHHQLESAAISALAHPNFPWEKVSPKKIRNAVEESDLIAVLTSARLAGHSSSATVKALEGECSRETAVFSPATSARQLEQIAARNPNLAAWCAMHPNGSGIQAPKEQEEIVRAFQANFSPVTLAGRTGKAASSASTTIEL